MPGRVRSWPITRFRAPVPLTVRSTDQTGMRVPAASMNKRINSASGASRASRGGVRASTTPVVPLPVPLGTGERERGAVAMAVVDVDLAATADAPGDADRARRRTHQVALLLP